MSEYKFLREKMYKRKVMLVLSLKKLNSFLIESALKNTIPLYALLNYYVLKLHGFNNGKHTLN